MTGVIDVDACSELAALKRNRYFTGQVLTEKDLSDEQSYLQEKARRHNRYLHGYGVVCGLRVVPGGDDERRTVVVQPGLAIDPWGREIVVAEPVPLRLSDRADAGSHGDAQRPVQVFVVLEYAEAPADLVPALTEPGDSGDPGAVMPSRTLESFQLRVRKEPPQDGEDPQQAFCELVAAALQQPVDANRLHRMLCDLLSQPCPPCEPDPAITLARIDLGPGGEVVAGGIDNCSHRRLVLSQDQILQILLCLLARLG
jgi:hypothetical protein